MNILTYYFIRKFNLDTSALCLDDDRNRVFERIYDKKIFTPKHNKPIIFDVENNPSILI